MKRFSGLNYYERKALREARAPQLAAERAAREAASMTCQCCGQRFLANTGTMAHHGYQRPGSGWQTASCMGAKFVPFEVSRDRLADMIEAIKAEIDRAEKHFAETDAETRPIRRTWTERVRPAGWTSYKSEDRFFDLTRANVAEYGIARAMRTTPDFDAYKAHELAAQRRNIDHVRAELAHAEGRFAGWVQTHRQVGKGKATVWEAVG